MKATIEMHNGQIIHYVTQDKISPEMFVENIVKDQGEIRAYNEQKIRRGSITVTIDGNEIFKKEIEIVDTYGREIRMV